MSARERLTQEHVAPFADDLGCGVRKQATEIFNRPNGTLFDEVADDHPAGFEVADDPTSDLGSYQACSTQQQEGLISHVLNLPGPQMDFALQSEACCRLPTITDHGE